MKWTDIVIFVENFCVYVYINKVIKLRRVSGHGYVFDHIHNFGQTISLVLMEQSKTNILPDVL